MLPDGMPLITNYSHQLINVTLSFQEINYWLTGMTHLYPKDLCWKRI